MNVIWFFSQIIVLFFISRSATNILFVFLRRFIKNERLVFYLMALLYFPGTVIHEMSHFFAATVFFLRVRDINLFPKIDGFTIKLGSVVYEKKDFVRGFLVGITPFFGGLICLYLISFFNLFPADNFWITLMMLYLIFVLSSTMFSSKQDLVDFLSMMPLIVLFAGLYYILGFDLRQIFDDLSIADYMIKFIKIINIYLFVSILINLALITILKILLRFLK